MARGQQAKLGTICSIYCNSCKSKTNHELKATHLRKCYEIEGEETGRPQLLFWEECDYRFWICRGCDTATLEEAWTAEGMVDDSNNQLWNSKYSPERKQKQRVPKTFRQLDANLARVYKEVIQSYNAGCKIITAMGLRALLEGICTNKGITDEDAWGLEEKLSKLEKNKFLPSNIVDALHNFKFMGDDAAHRLETPNDKELSLALSVMEDLLNFLYEVEYQLASKAKRLAKFRSKKLGEIKKRRKTKGTSSK